MARWHALQTLQTLTPFPAAFFDLAKRTLAWSATCPATTTMPALEQRRDWRQLVRCAKARLRAIVAITVRWHDPPCSVHDPATKCWLGARCRRTNSQSQTQHKQDRRSWHNRVPRRRPRPGQDCGELEEAKPNQRTPAAAQNQRTRTHETAHACDRASRDRFKS